MLRVFVFLRAARRRARMRDSRQGCFFAETTRWPISDRNIFPPFVDAVYDRAPILLLNNYK